MTVTSNNTTLTSTGENYEVSLDDRLPEETKAFLAERKEAGKLIDPENCEISWWYTEVGDPYDVWPKEEVDCVGRATFVRSLPDGDWVWEGDLQKETWEALEERMKITRFPHGGPCDPAWGVDNEAGGQGGGSR
jgi:hypothetical protein